MSDENAIELLQPHHLQVAGWLVASSLPGSPLYKTAEEVADEIGLTKSQVYRIARRDDVRAAARMMLTEALTTEGIPRILRMVLREAEDDAKFGLQVLQWLQKLGIEVFGSTGESPKKPTSVNLNVPGGFDAAIRVVPHDRQA